MVDTELCPLREFNLGISRNGKKHNHWGLSCCTRLVFNKRDYAPSNNNILYQLAYKVWFIWQIIASSFPVDSDTYKGQADKARS